VEGRLSPDGDIKMAALRNLLISKGFKVHNNKSEELVASKFHSSMKSTRIVAHTGVCKKTGKHLTVNAHTHFKAVFVNRQGHWRTIATGSAFAQRDWKQIDMIIKAIEHLATKAPTCKHCKAPKFKAKSGNVVCSNACWAGWGKRKPKKAKAASTPHKSQAAAPQPQKTAQEQLKARKRKSKTVMQKAAGARAARLRGKRDLVVEQFHVGQLVKRLPSENPDMGIIIECEDHPTRIESRTARRRGTEPQNAQFITVRMMNGDTRKGWNYREEAPDEADGFRAFYFTAAS
jgi:uncharacterized Zn finger protein (UPF0148 family)